MTWAELSDAANIAQVLGAGAIAVGAFFLRGITRRIDEVMQQVTGVKQHVAGIEKEFRALNGRLIRLETWRDDHVRSDDERHERVQDEIDCLWNLAKRAS